MKNILLSTAFIFASLIFFCSCKSDEGERPNDTFRIIGYVKDIPDSTIVLLKTTGNTIDSSMVLNEQFTLQGSLVEPTIVLLIIPSTGDYKMFWVETNEMTFSSERNKFLNAKITGSKLQLESDKLLAKVLSIRTERDSLRILLDGKEKNLDEKAIRSRINKLRENEQEEYFLIVKNNPSSYVSVHILDVYKTTWGRQKVEPLYHSLSDEMKKTTYGKSIHSYIEFNVNPEIGDRFIDFESRDINGKIIRLSEIKGRTVLLDFWASWCGACREMNKELILIYDDYNKFGFEILGVSGDSKREHWIEAIKQDKLIWTNVFDGKATDSTPFLIYGINFIPDNFLINSEGIIVARNLHGNDLRKKLDALLK